MCHEIFDLHFVHDLNPSGPLINKLKYFRIRYRISRYIQIFKSSTVCIIQRSQALQYASHRGVKLCGVHHTAESSDQKCSKNSVVCISPLSQTLWCASLCGVELCCVMHTAESIIYQVSVLIQSFTNAIFLWCLKIFNMKIILWVTHCLGNLFYFRSFSKNQVERR